MFRIVPQSKEESLRTYIKRFQAEVAEVEKPDNRLATMVFNRGAFKQGLHVHSPLSEKLNKRKYDYITLVECFDIVDDLMD
ncbi:hypothetical protein DVH24_004712 [Malus domestica]|uniref:Retrotransposon gag domain-containing protein n=1 Tax=Malus domestica TaxID=3750 RepID=A0A498IAM1_MALDO|nr:hypothetical protein DVH24_004712 [Malus domestica]